MIIKKKKAYKKRKKGKKKSFEHPQWLQTLGSHWAGLHHAGFLHTTARLAFHLYLRQPVISKHAECSKWKIRTAGAPQTVLVASAAPPPKAGLLPALHSSLSLHLPK